MELVSLKLTVLSSPERVEYHRSLSTRESGSGAAAGWQGACRAIDALTLRVNFFSLVKNKYDFYKNVGYSN